MLLKNHGPIEYMFWNGGYLEQSKDAELEDRFWDSGQYQDPKGDWQVGETYRDKEESPGKAIRVMGMVRRGIRPDSGHPAVKSWDHRTEPSKQFAIHGFRGGHGDNNVLGGGIVIDEGNAESTR